MKQAVGMKRKRTRMGIFPKKPQQPEGPVRAKKLLAFRAEPDLADYVAAREADGYKKTEVISKLCRVTLDVQLETDEIDQQLTEAAAASGISYGQLVGRLAKEAWASKSHPAPKRKRPATDTR